MKKLRLVLALVVIYSFPGCKKDSSQQMNCPDFGYENGYQLTSAAGTYVSHFDSSGSNYNAVAAWLSSDNLTTVIVGGPMMDDSSVHDEMIIQFFGKQTGTYTIVPYGVNGNPISANQAIMWLSNQGPIVSNSGTLNVAQFDSPGGKICGSFSGDFITTTGQGDTIHMNVSNGAFSANVQ